MTVLTLHINNMICDCCIEVIKMELAKIPVEIDYITLGEVKISFDKKKISYNEIEEVLNKNGFSIITNKDDILVEEIKRVVIDLVHHTTYNAMVRNSDYLVGKFAKTYPYLSTLFSKYEGITLEKYIILQKTEKAKSLIQDDELTLSEIAFSMGYSSVQYLSTQFKNITGISVTDFKKSPARYRKSIDKVK